MNNESTIRKSTLLFPDQLAIHDEVVDYYKEMTTEPVELQESTDEQDIWAKQYEEQVLGTEVETKKVPVAKTWFKKLLIGYAGTGKTTTVAAIVETLKLDYGANIVLSAPTHKAVRVAKKKSGISGVEFSTLQRVLGVKAKPNYNTGEMEFEPYYNAPTSLGKKTMLIIDEVSMVNQNLYDYLMTSQTEFPILFVGDSVQIPPVSDGKKKTLSDSAVFIPSIRERDNIQVLELTQVRRQAAGNPIIALATDIRNTYKSVIAKSVYINAAVRKEDGTGISTSSGTGAGNYDKELIKSWFTSLEYKENPDFCRVIAYRNATVTSFNKEIRKILFGEEKAAEPYSIGERLVFEEPYGKPDAWGRRQILFQNSDEVEVVAVKPITLALRKPVLGVKAVTTQTVNLPGLLLTLRYENDEGEMEEEEAKVPLVKEDMDALLKEVEAIAKTCYDKALRKDMWKAYFALNESVGFVNYAYAITAHKSQGSTYNNAFVVQWDIDVNFRNEEKNRIMYVAVTRASQRLHISA